MSDLGVLVPILAPSGFSTRQLAATDTAEGREPLGVPSASSDEQPTASPRTADPLTGLAIQSLAAGLIPFLQQTEDRPGATGNEPADGNGQAGEEGDASAEVSDGGDGGTPDAAPQAGNAIGPAGLTPEQQQVVQELQKTDAEIRRHEQAHAAAGGPYAGAPSYDYTRGPDGRLYAVGGDVQIDVAPIPGNPDATIQKMQLVRRAALAPASPSPQDQRVAAIAQQRINEARGEQRELEVEEREAAAAEREEAQERAERLQPAGASDFSGGSGSVVAVASGSGSDTAGTGPGPAAITGAAAAAGQVFNIIA